MNIEGPYAHTVGDDPEQLCWFPLAPSYLLFDGGAYHALWLLDDDVGAEEYTAGSSCCVYRSRPDLRYTSEDWIAAGRVSERIVWRIMTEYPLDDIKKTERELAVISALRKAGMSQGGIFKVFQEQAIGDSYRGTCSLIGSLTMADELLRDALGHPSEFVHWTNGYEFWFNLTSALRWWYPYRRERGKRILPEDELKALLKGGVGGYWLGFARRKVEGVVFTMVGADLELARRMGVIGDGNKENGCGNARDGAQ